MRHEEILRHKSLKGIAGPTVEFKKRYLKVATNNLILGDCVEVLPCLPDGCVDLIHTSPPYNIEKEYAGYADRKPLDAYKDFLDGVIAECCRVLKPHGSIFWQTGYTTSSESPNDIVPIDLISYEIFKRQANIHLRDRIIWNYFGGMSFQKKFKNRHETIMWYSKSDDNGNCEPYFNVDDVRERSREFDKRNNLLGRNPGNVWSVDRVAFGSIEQTSHIAVFPEEVSEKIIRACSRPSALVLDPMAGSGTTCKVAKSMGRRWIGVEISPTYYNDAAIRLGFQPTGEFETILSWIVKEKAYRVEGATLTVDDVCHRLSLLARGLHVSEYANLWEMAQAQLATSDMDAYKDAKVSVWKLFDNYFSANGSDNFLLYVDTALERSFKNVKKYNGYRKFKICLELIQRFQREFERPSMSSRDTVTRILNEEPSSFKRLAKGRYKLIALEKRVKKDAFARSRQIKRARGYQPPLLLPSHS